MSADRPKGVINLIILALVVFAIATGGLVHFEKKNEEPGPYAACFLISIVVGLLFYACTRFDFEMMARGFLGCVGILCALCLILAHVELYHMYLNWSIRVRENRQRREALKPYRDLITIREMAMKSLVETELLHKHLPSPATSEAAERARLQLLEVEQLIASKVSMRNGEVHQELESKLAAHRELLA